MQQIIDSGAQPRKNLINVRATRFVPPVVSRAIPEILDVR
jgi:hypothetical protein